MTDISRKTTKTWIKEETDENEIIDLLNTSKLSQNILHKIPNQFPKEKKQSFEMSSDGKLIIHDLDSNKGIKRSRDEDMEEEVDNNSDDDVMSNIQSLKTSNTKASGYKTGGKGIHRPV